MNKFLLTGSVFGLAVSAAAMAGGADAMQHTTAMAHDTSGFYAGVEGGVALLRGIPPVRIASMLNVNKNTQIFSIQLPRAFVFS